MCDPFTHYPTPAGVYEPSLQTADVLHPVWGRSTQTHHLSQTVIPACTTCCFTGCCEVCFSSTCPARIKTLHKCTRDVLARWLVAIYHSFWVSFFFLHVCDYKKPHCVGKNTKSCRCAKKDHLSTTSPSKRFQSIRICSTFSRRVSTPQDLPPVGHAAAGQLLLPLLHRRGHPAAAQRSPPGQRLQWVHSAVLRPARWDVI